jgi:indoleamine 2,3-dioxygenase
MNEDEKLTKAYNEAVLALKRFRDAHMIIATLYIVGPARRAARVSAMDKPTDGGVYGVLSTPTDGLLKGTGGTDLVKFLKDTRSRTIEAKVE